MSADTIAPAAPTDDAAERISSTLHDMTQGLLGLQNLLGALDDQNLGAAAQGMVDGAAAIVARLGIIADRQQAVTEGFRTQSDAEWLGLAEFGSEGAAA